MQDVIEQLKQLNRIRTSETYSVTLASFMKFRDGQDILLCEIDSDAMMLYEAWLKANSNCPNTISFYMRILRAVYNRAVEKDLIEQKFPFKHVYTGIDKTMKRAVPLKTIKRIKELDLTTKSHLDYARDMFLFSFYTRGMSFVDMAYLKKSDLKMESSPTGEERPDSSLPSSGRSAWGILWLNMKVISPRNTCCR